jgi:methyl-accepting chemotaxis protein
VIQDDVKEGIHAINAKASSTERRIESMAKRMNTIAKTIGSNTDSMTEMKGNQIEMMKNMAKMMSSMKDMASKGSKGKRRSRIRRYQGKRILKKAGKAGERVEEEDAGWSDK